ncbi:Uma2 family endonuclease [Kamptonema cortianum]|nr:Uma2 family endonuclease [Kamptonema cortianum]
MTVTLTPPLNGIVLKGIHWDTFQALVRDLESQPSKRLTYDNGVLEIWMPLPPHESYKRWLGRLVEIVTEELDVEIRSLSACTWSRKDLAKGVEADECYYIQNEAAIRTKMLIDLTVDPPPDLAIEVDITSLSLPRLPIYQGLGVPEVWRFDGSRLQFVGLIDGEYREVNRSIAIPLLTVEAVQTLLQQASEMGETSWAKQVRQWVREQQNAGN